MFSRHYNSGLADHDLGLGPGWRHSYQLFLTRHDATTLHIVQSDGRRNRFERADASVVRYVATEPADGFVEPSPPPTIGTSTSLVWHVPDGRRLVFRGSWLTRIEHEQTDDVLTLRYGGCRLQTVIDGLGRVLTLHYTPGSIGLGKYNSATDMTQPGHLESLNLPDGSVVMTTIIESITELLEVAFGIPRQDGFT